MLDEWAPITFSMGFLEAPLERVTTAVETWAAQQPDGRRPRVARTRQPFPEVLRNLEQEHEQGVHRL
jgi:hypothetical protein